MCLKKSSINENNFEWKSANYTINLKLTLFLSVFPFSSIINDIKIVRHALQSLFYVQIDFLYRQLEIA